MSIFSYKLSNPSVISKLSDIEVLISASTRQVPVSLYALMSNEGTPTAYKLCCEEDIESLKSLCKGHPVSILYTPVALSVPLPFKGFQQVQLKACNTADFYVLGTEGVQDGCDVPLGAEVQRVWTVRVTGNTADLQVKCVEGEFFGVSALLQARNGHLEISATVKCPMKKGWCSSIWRAFTAGKAFGPWLWIELNVLSQ